MNFFWEKQSTPIITNEPLKMLENKNLHHIFSNDFYFRSFIVSLQEVSAQKETLESLKNLEKSIHQFHDQKNIVLIAQHVLKNLYLIQDELQKKQLLPYLVINQFILSEYEIVTNNVKKGQATLKSGYENLSNLIKLIESQKINNHSIQIFMIQLSMKYLEFLNMLRLREEFFKLDESLLNQIENLADEYKTEIRDIEIDISSNFARKFFLDNNLERAEQLANKVLFLCNQKNNDGGYKIFGSKVNAILLLANLSLNKGKLHDEHLEQNEKILEKLIQTFKKDVQHAMIMVECVDVCFNRNLMAEQNKVQIKTNFSQSDLVDIHDQALKEFERNKSFPNIDLFFNQHQAVNVQLHNLLKNSKTY